MRFSSLGSGSDGNGLLVGGEKTRVLADCGFSLSETVSRLARCGVAPESVDAILVTHEHDDHICGVARFARKFNVPVWLTYGTLPAAGGGFSNVTTPQGFVFAPRFAT